MLKGEIIDLSSKNKYNISFFDDDSIDIIRQKIGASVDIHPDRLHILVGLKLPADYYIRDPRHWEALFERLSYNNEPIEQDIFSEYQLQYRSPSTSIPFKAYDKVEWMSGMNELITIYKPSSEFIEYRIFGVEETKSFILPLSSMSSTLVSRIASVNLPIPENTKLFNTFYESEQFVRFLIKPYNEVAESNASVYYPLLRSTTPSKISEETIRLLMKTSNTLNELLEIKVPEPTEISIIRSRFYIPWVDTDFGSAVRTRFEQLFYGITVSKEVPCITIFTSKDQTSRHKFFTEDSKNKNPLLDMTMWNSWWSVKPARNIPSLILFRGKAKNYFDRITITASDMVITTHRPEGNTETIDQIKRQIADWISEFDAILPFISKSDLYKTRWELQDISFLAKYSDKLEEFDLLRFNCISSIFDIADKTKSQFSMMRTDHTNHGLSALEVKILQMMKDTNGNLNPNDVSVELSVPLQNARELIQHVQSRIDDDPRIGEKAFRGYPTLRLGPDYVIVSSISKLEKSLQYSNLLRYILSNPDSDVLNRVCPKRAEKVVAESAVVSTEPLELDAALEEEYSDLFAFLEEEGNTDATSIAETTDTTTTQRISTEQKQGTNYNYFKSRLQKFDPITFDPVKSQYPKKCEQKHQPIILSDNDLKRLSGGPYDVKNNLAEDRIINIENPDGSVVCPDYWCMRDQIPLSDDQLDKSKGEIRCPVCNGQLQTRATDNPRDFPLIKRETGFIYPGYVDYKSPHNGRPMPCCFKKSRSKKNDKTEQVTEDKYYVLGVDKTAKPERIAFLPPTILASLRINEKYESFKNNSVRRLMSPNKGFFRTGLGKASENLSKILGLKIKIPSPRESIETILKCSFLHTWKQIGTTHLDSIENDLKKINKDLIVQTELAKLISGIDEAFHKKELSALEDLEYSALALQCDIFRIFTDTATLGCVFYSPIVRPRSRAIIILQNEDEIDVLAYTERKTRGFEFRCNIYDSPFTKETYTELEKLRNESCKLKIPSYNEALLAIQQLLPLVEADDYEIILDPYNRGQAFYVANKLILPFQSTPLPNVLQAKISGYKEIPTEKLPDYEFMKTLLETAAKISTGFAYKEDLYNNHRKKVEILLNSGLRIPIKPIQLEERMTEVNEVIETVRELGESELTFGNESADLKREKLEISYSAEVYEFLLFQLTKDLEDDYKELRNTLLDISPKITNVKFLLQKWFDETTQFVNIKEPKQFLSKIREPCNDKCDGELCGWDGNVCKVQINSVIKKDKLFHRLLTTLIENSKIRSMVLDGRTTPFFSTILYLELPHELIVTDYELPA